MTLVAGVRGHFEMSPNKMQKLIAKHMFECFEKGKGKTAKSKYSRTELINNLLAIYGEKFFVVCNFSYLKILFFIIYIIFLFFWMYVCMCVCIYVVGPSCKHTVCALAVRLPWR